MKALFPAVLLALLAACGSKSSPASDAGIDAGTSGVTDAGTADGGTPSEDTPTVSEQIAQDEYDGTIDAKTAALYQLLAQFSPRRLPPKYDARLSSAGPPSVLHMLTAKAHVDEYSAVEKAAVQAMLASPEDANWLTFPADMPVQNFSQEEDPACWRQFSVGEHGVATFDFGAPIPTNHFVIQPLESNQVTVPRQAELRDRINKALNEGGLGAYLDSVYEKYKSELKMNEPSALTFVKTYGGKIPIFVGTCDGDNEAFAHPDGFVFVSVEAAFDDATLRKVIIPHEVFHVFEYGYTQADFEDSGRSLGWPYEAFAVGVEDLVASDVRRWSGKFANTKLFAGGLPAMDRSFKCPEEPLDSLFSGSCKNRGAQAAKRYGGDYSKFVLVKFLMRNKGLVPGDFWQKFAAANGDPRGLVDAAAAAEFQVALVGDSQSKTYFDTADRAAFFTAGQVSCDLDTDDLKRYTYWLDPAKIAKSKLLRATPTDVSSRTTEGLTKLDASIWPVMPGATHRLLVEVPPGATVGKDPYIGLMDVYAKITAGASFTSSRLTFDAHGKPGRTFTAEYVEGSPSGDDHFSFSRAAGETLPGFVLLVVSNFGGGPLNYQGAVNFPNACTTNCKSYYDDQVTIDDCMTKWCWRDCSDPSTAQGCNDAMQKCIQKVDTTMSDSATMEEGYFCDYICWPPQGLDEPLSIPCNGACNKLQCWDQQICGGSGACDATKPAGFYSIQDWPTMECINWFAAGKVKCP